MLAAAWAKLAQFHAPGVIAAVLLSCIISLLALCAGESNDGANIFFLRCHVSLLTRLTF